MVKVNPYSTDWKQNFKANSFSSININISIIFVYKCDGLHASNVNQSVFRINLWIVKSSWFY